MGGARHHGGGIMGKIAKIIGVALLAGALKGSYHLGKTSNEDAKYDITRRDGIAYLVDKTVNEYARLDEGKPLHDQPAFCPPPPPPPAPHDTDGTASNYLHTLADYLRRMLE